MTSNPTVSDIARKRAFRKFSGFSSASAVTTRDDLDDLDDLDDFDDTNGGDELEWAFSAASASVLALASE